MDIRLKLLSFIVTGFFVIFIFSLLRNRKLKESLSLVWLGFAVLMIIVTAWFASIEKLAGLLRIREPNNLLLFLAILFVISACIIISVEVSNLSYQIKVLIQKLALYEKNKIARKKHQRKPKRK